MNAPRERWADRFATFGARCVMTVATWLAMGAVVGVITGCSVASAAIGSALITALLAITAFGVRA